MLVLSRRPNEKILFPAINASVQVVAIKPGVVRLGIEAPPEVKVLREELAGKSAGEPAPESKVAEPADRAGLSRLERLIERRLGLVGKGLGVLREQLVAALNPEALRTLDEVEHELRLLRERVRDEGGDTSSRRPAKPGRRTKALLVEDNAQERELMALFLRSEGLDVDTAGDGCDALDYLRARGRPDLVLLDMGMPRVDGPTAVREIRQNPAFAGLKIFAVSGHGPDEYQLPVGPAGVDRWFQKPIDPHALVRDLARELGQAPAVV